MLHDLLDLVFPDQKNSGRRPESPSLRTIIGPDDDYREAGRVHCFGQVFFLRCKVGNYELLFPFNEESETLSHQLQQDKVFFDFTFDLF